MEIVSLGGEKDIEIRVIKKGKRKYLALANFIDNPEKVSWVDHDLLKAKIGAIETLLNSKC
ncbi:MULTISPECIES: hypothetical protein [Bacillus]|uniref:hypothetical protein n=1 Tax=Bacillus TaxID=1386 RepID=UPI000308BE71|nr:MULTISPECIES: hypothetical protein [Bacillus]